MRTLARTISFGGVTLGTGTVADSTGYRYALGTAGTLLALRATNQHALAIDDLVRWLALALDAVAFCSNQQSKHSSTLKATN